MPRVTAISAWCVALLLPLLCMPIPVAAVGHVTELELSLREEIFRVPLPPGSGVPALIATTYRPQGAGPFPLIVLSHGSPANAAERAKMGRYRAIGPIREFVNRGFAVIVPMRRGYGLTGGAWAETFYRCAAPDYAHAGNEAAIDLLSTLAFVRNFPDIDHTRVVLVGQSAGGFASIAAASRQPPGVIAVVNFSGGRGGQPATSPGEPCGSDAMERVIGQYAKTIRVPVLWHYAENDRYFSPVHVNAWFQAFQAAGAPGTLVMQPPFGRDGHSLFALPQGLPIWTTAFDMFFEQFGFRLPAPAVH